MEQPLLYLRCPENKDDDCGPYFIPQRVRGPRNPGCIPFCLWAIIVLMQRAFVQPAALYDCADLFAGQCAVSKAYKAQNMMACALDTEIDPRDVHWPQESDCWPLCCICGMRFQSCPSVFGWWIQVVLKVAVHVPYPMLFSPTSACQGHQYEPRIPEIPLGSLVLQAQRSAGCGDIML